jgi:hypothetical protein
MEGIKLIEYGIEKEQEDKLFQRWVAGYQHSESFDDFKNKLINKHISDNKTEEEILSDVAVILSPKYKVGD